jgi:broad specificity phosphatase PhoE
MADTQMTLVCVSHGQADHNLEGNKKVMQFTDEENPVLDTDLTDVGRKQGEMVGKRLADQKLDFSISSDLKRAKDTAKAVALENDSVETVEEWNVVRERRLGIFEGSYENSQK